MPGEEVPKYFTHRACGNSLTVPLYQSFLFLRAYIILEGPKYSTDVTLSIYWNSKYGSSKILNWITIDHLVVFDIDISNREEMRSGSPSQFDCDNVEFEFEVHHSHCECSKERFGNKETCLNLAHRIKGCGIRILETEYNQPYEENNAESERSSETEYNNQCSGESDAENKRSKKPMKMAIVTSHKPSTLSDLNLGGASSSFLGDEYHSLYPSDPCLEEEALYVDPMMTEQQDTKTLTEDPSSSPQLINLFSEWRRKRNIEWEKVGKVGVIAAIVAAVVVSGVWATV